MKSSLNRPGFGTILMLALLSFTSPVWSQESLIRFESSGQVDWLREEFNAQASFNLAQAGIKLPAGRFMGEETLGEAYPRLIRPYLLSIRVDSSSTIGSLVEKGEVSLEDIDRFSLEAEKIPPSLSADLARMTGSYTISLGKISAFLSQHRRAAEPAKPLIPAYTADYTGIIIIASEELPVHGRRAQARMEPCLFPKIWDTNMNLIYERNMFEPSRGLIVRYAESESIFRPTPSGLEGDLAALVGPNPLRILAREVFGINPTDPVIDTDDALRIISSENNRRLLGEGRIILVVPQLKNK